MSTAQWQDSDTPLAILTEAASSATAIAAPIATSLTSKLTRESSSQMEEDEIEGNLHVEESTSSLKRRASSSFQESDESSSRKRLKEDHARPCLGTSNDNAMGAMIDGRALVNDLCQELECGCCSALVYKPVTVQPCQHFFCGRYVHHNTIAKNSILIVLIVVASLGSVYVSFILIPTTRLLNDSYP